LPLIKRILFFLKSFSH